MKKHFSSYWICSLLCLASIFLSEQGYTQKNQNMQWYRHGPYAVCVNSLAVAPSDHNIVYLGTYGYGLYKSTNKGIDWEACGNINLPLWQDTTGNNWATRKWWEGNFRHITAISVYPDNADHLWIALHGKGLYESTDGGHTWEKAHNSLPDITVCSEILINENDTNEIYVPGGFNYEQSGMGIGGLYRTYSGGENWEFVEGLPFEGSYVNVTTIVRDPNNSQCLYVGFSTDSDPNVGLMKSVDNGNTWSLINNNLYFTNIVIEPRNSDAIWATAVNGWGEGLLVKSSDGGVSFETVDYENLMGFSSSLYADNNFNLFMERFSSCENILRSDDYGQEWDIVDDVYVFSNTHAPLSNKMFAYNNETFIANAAGFYYSSNYGDSQQLRTNNMYNAYILKLAQNPKELNELYASSSQGLWKSMDYGTTWQQLIDKPVRPIAIDPKHIDTLYFAAGIFMRSFDGGNSFTSIKGDIAGGIGDIVINPQSTNIIYCSSSPDGIHELVYKSTGYGNNWQLLVVLESNQMGELTIDPLRPDTLYCDNYRSIDGGLTWNNIGRRVVAIHPENPDIIFGFTTNELFRSDDFGNTWSLIDIYEGYTVGVNSFRHTFILAPQNPDHMYYSTANKGIRYSIDGGENWNFLNGNYEKRTTDFIIDPISHVYYIGTYGDGVWTNKAPITTIDAKHNETKASLKAYPNPFNNELIIEFNSQLEQLVQLIIRDVMGKQISVSPYTVVRGKNTLLWDGKEDNKPVLPGIYSAIILQNNKVLGTTKVLKY